MSDQPNERRLPDNIRHSQETDIYVPGGFRTRNPSKRVGAEQRMRLCGQWDRYTGI